MDGFNMVDRNEDSILDQLYEKQIFLAYFYFFLLRRFKFQE